MNELSEEEIKVQDLIEYIRFGTQLKYDIKAYIVAIERFIRHVPKRKRKE